MIIIGEARVEESVTKAKFACDLVKCKGACCTMPGGRGAPLTEDEIPEIECAFPIVKKYIPDLHLKIIDEFGMYEGSPGNRSTVCVDDRDCVFVYYDDDIARCALEKGYLNGETTWRKPISCHLFPIRISPDPRPIVRYEKIEPCAVARERGEQENIPLSDFLKEPLIRRFGEAWYNELDYVCKEIRSEE